MHNLVGGGAFAEKGVLEEEQVCRVKSPVSDTEVSVGCEVQREVRTSRLQALASGRGLGRM